MISWLDAETHLVLRRSGSQFAARCPAHDDSTASLMVRRVDDHAKLFCHAGCDYRDITNAMGVEDKTVPQSEASYKYLDESGVCRFKIVRLPGKRFFVMTPDGDMGWKPGLNESGTILYKLPDITRASSVIIVEGEKDADTLTALGFAATCNPFGAGKWKERYSEPLRGKRVAIIADADDPGREHAKMIADSLSGKVASLRVLEMPGAKDVTEWLESGGTTTGLVDLIRSAKEINPPGLSVVPCSAVVSGYGDIEWLVDDLLSVGGISVLSARPKAGKSTLARVLCAALERNVRFLGRQTTKADSLYISLEDGPHIVREHVLRLGMTGDNPSFHFAYLAPPSIPKMVAGELARKPYGLVVIDTLIHALGMDINDYSSVYRRLSEYRDIAGEHHAHILFIHHMRKAQAGQAADNIMGTTAIFGAPDCALMLDRGERGMFISTKQRTGRCIENAHLEYDAETGWIDLAGASSFDTRQASSQGQAAYD